MPLGVVGESGFPAWFDQEAGLGTVAQPELGGWVTGVEKEVGGGEGDSQGWAQSSRGRHPNHPRLTLL